MLSTCICFKLRTGSYENVYICFRGPPHQHIFVFSLSVSHVIIKVFRISARLPLYGLWLKDQLNTFYEEGYADIYKDI